MSRSAQFYHMHGHPRLPTHNVPMRHAYVIVGWETIFLCHQIMGFMEGHNYELVLEVQLPKHVLKGVLDDRKKNGSTHFLANQGKNEYTLPAVKAGEVTCMRADIWNYFPKRWGRKWPWGNNAPLFTDVDVRITRVVHSRHLSMNEVSRKLESYTLFGKGAEAHLYHSVVAQPDYDHVASLAQVPDWIQSDQLAASVEVGMRHLPWRRRSGHCRNPLPPGKYSVLYFGIDGYRDQHGGDPEKWTPVPEYTINVGQTWWFSTRVVNFFPENPCGNTLIEIPVPR